ncbi:DUF1983 domain-containing protein [Cronobacter turicensis]|nr:DUF1983 domain-containing protein [Cronobacter turicensis]
MAYECQWRKDNGDWVNVPRTSSLGFDVQGIYAGRYMARVSAVNASDVASVWQTSDEATLTGKVGQPPVPLNFRTTAINWGIQLDWTFPDGADDTLMTEIQYAAAPDGSDVLLLSDVPYPARSYTQLGLRAGQIFWYRARLVDRIGNQSAWTAWVRGMANDNAEDYLGDITGDFLTSADGKALQQQIDTNIEAVMQNALANNATADHQWKQYGEVRADILVVKTTIADVDKALAEMSTQVQAQIGSVTAALEDKLTAVVDASGATAIHTLKAGVRINGDYYSAGMSIAVLAQAGQPVVTRVAFNADQFVLTTGSGASQFSPFAVVGGQVFMSSAFIQDGTITSAKIGAFIQSNNYVAGATGWIISKEGTAEFNAVTVRGTIIATEGRFSMSGPGNNVVIDGAGVTVNLANGGRIVLGSW